MSIEPRMSPILLARMLGIFTILVVPCVSFPSVLITSKSNFYTTIGNYIGLKNNPFVGAEGFVCMMQGYNSGFSEIRLVKDEGTLLFQSTPNGNFTGNFPASFYWNAQNDFEARLNLSLLNGAMNGSFSCEVKHQINGINITSNSTIMFNVVSDGPLCYPSNVTVSTDKDIRAGCYYPNSNVSDNGKESRYEFIHLIYGGNVDTNVKCFKHSENVALPYCDINIQRVKQELQQLNIVNTSDSIVECSTCLEFTCNSEPPIENLTWSLHEPDMEDPVDLESVTGLLSVDIKTGFGSSTIFIKHTGAFLNFNITCNAVDFGLKLASVSLPLMVRELEDEGTTVTATTEASDNPGTIITGMYPLVWSAVFILWIVW